MSNKKDWLSRKADDAVENSPQVMPLADADKNRPAPADQPTAVPEMPEPIPMNELLKLFEKAAKALHDATLSMEEANTAMRDITVSTGRTQAERSVISKAEVLISQVESAKASVDKIAESVREYRGSMGNTSSSRGWIN